MSITAVVVNYRTVSFLPALMRDLFGNDLIREVIVVDNSNELSDSHLIRDYPGLKVISNRENRGFGAAVNQAVSLAVSKWILIVNPDVRLTTGCVDELLKTGIKYASPLLGPRFFWDDQRQFRLPPATGGCLWIDAAYTCAEKFRLDAEIYSFYWILRHQRFWEASDPFVEPFLSGACILVNREWIHSIGGLLFDERFFLYFEDTDLCVRALIEDVRPLCVPQSVAIHYYDQAPSPERDKKDLMARAHNLFMEKYYGKRASLSLEAAPCKHDIVQLGKRDIPIVFQIDKGFLDEQLFFEVGINPYFVPFAQALLRGKTFEFPSAIWLRLSEGTYYGRVRGEVSGIKKIWQWRK